MILLLSYILNLTVTQGCSFRVWKPRCALNYAGHLEERILDAIVPADGIQGES